MHHHNLMITGSLRFMASESVEASSLVGGGDLLEYAARNVHNTRDKNEDVR